MKALGIIVVLFRRLRCMLLFFLSGFLLQTPAFAVNADATSVYNYACGIASKNHQPTASRLAACYRVYIEAKPIGDQRTVNYNAWITAYNQDNEPELRLDDARMVDSVLKANNGDSALAAVVRKALRFSRETTLRVTQENYFVDDPDQMRTVLSEQCLIAAGY